MTVHNVKQRTAKGAVKTIETAYPSLLSRLVCRYKRIFSG
jgi:hypothetical protein